MADYQGFANSVLRAAQPPQDDFRQNALIAFKLRQDASDRALQERQLGLLEKREARAAETAERQASAADIELGLKLNNIMLQRASAVKDEPTWRRLVEQTAAEFDALKPGLGDTIRPYVDRFADRDVLVESLVDAGKRYEQMMLNARQEDQQSFLGQQGDLDRATRLQAAQLGKSTTTVNVGPTGIDYGKPEAGLAWKRNPDGTVALDERGAPIAVPYQGGSVFREQQGVEAAGAERAAQEQRQADVVLQDINRALSLAEGQSFFDPATGGPGQLVSGIGGTRAHDLKNLLESVKANVGFDRVVAMRKASPTGAALGNITEGERASLQATLGSLEQSQSREQFERNLKRLNNIYLDLVHGKGNGPERMALEEQAAERPPAADLSKLSDEELLKQLGITQ